jgi:hypothetical protein
MQHSPNVELLQFWPASSCQVGGRLWAQTILTACENNVTFREHPFPLTCCLLLNTQTPSKIIPLNIEEPLLRLVILDMKRR